jgi:hypothetical protein
VKAQQCGRLEENGDTLEPAWPNPERAESGNQPIPDAEIGSSPTRTVHQQQLMFGQNGFGDDSPQTSWLSEANNHCDEMDDENEQITPGPSYPAKTKHFALIENSLGTGFRCIRCRNREAIWVRAGNTQPGGLMVIAYMDPTCRASVQWALAIGVLGCVDSRSRL